MEPQNQNKISPKILYIIGGILLFLILISGLITLSSNAKKRAQEKQITDQAEKIKSALSLTPTPTYVPPPNFAYHTVEGVNFLPKKINSFTLDQDNIMKTSLQVYPGLSGVPLMNKINEDIFAWLALNEYFQTADPSKVSSTFSLNKIGNMSIITKDLVAMKTAYNPTVMKLDGYFVMIRYKGTLPGNVAKLKKKESDLQPLANQLIKNYHTKAVSDPNSVLASFNKDNTVLLLNNREPSRVFNNYSMYPPVVADENYDTVVKSLPVGQVSDIITLTTSLNGSNSPEDYAYGFFYIYKKTGENLPVDALANNYVAKAAIQ